MQENEHITKSIMHLKEFHDLHNRCARRAKGSELDFITCIKRDGSGVTGAAHIPEMIDAHQNDEFILHRLSITEDTWIAIGFNSFIVKLKNSTNENIF